MSPQEMDSEKAESSMLPRNDCTEEGNRLYQVVAAVIVCYICICGGNLCGFTSSAIPSMRQVSYHVDKICSSTSSSTFQNITGEDDIVLGSLNRVSVNPVQCTNVLAEDINDFQNITDTQASWIGATVSVKMLGPRGSIIFLSAPIFLQSWVLTALARSILMVFIGRFLGGFALGLGISAAPLYIIDTASLTLRGPLGTLTQFLFTLGVLSSFILGSFLDWRNLAWTSAALVLPCILMLVFVPESPVWLLANDRVSEAEKSFYNMRGKSANFKSFLELHTESHTDVNQNNNESRSGISILWNLNKAERKSCTVAFVLCIFQQLCGINGINYYTLSIFKAASEGSSAFVLSGHVSSIIVAFVFCVATFPSYILIEKCGRKVLLLCSIAVMILSSASLGCYFFIKENVHDSFVFRMIPLVCLILFVLSYSSGFGPVLYIFVTELLSPDIRTVFSPIAVSINWLSVFAVTKSFPDLILVTGIHGVFWLYACLSAIGLIFVIFCVPETKGKTEKEIEKYFW